MGMAVLGVAVAVVGVVNRNLNETLKSLKKCYFYTSISDFEFGGSISEVLCSEKSN